jgi:excisionase family DNA binding protein
MPRRKTACETLTVGQLARRWGISRDHVRRLISDGRLRGAFTIPSTGRYGATVKIPLTSVLQAENESWLMAPAQTERARPKSPRRGDDPGPAYKHFPKLRANLEPPASGSGEGVQD